MLNSSLLHITQHFKKSKKIHSHRIYLGERALAFHIKTAIFQRWKAEQEAGGQKIVRGGDDDHAYAQANQTRDKRATFDETLVFGKATKCFRYLSVVIVQCEHFFFSLEFVIRLGKRN